MKKILSNEQCDNIISYTIDKEWDRIDRYGKYNQMFIHDDILLNQIETFFGNTFTKTPILKILKFDRGDLIPTFSADYSKMSDPYYERYTDTNFIIQIHLNSNFSGGNITKLKETFNPKTGYGIIQNKTEKCSISQINDGSAYFLFVFISNIKSTSLL